ncbi:hypothetical protein D3C71_1266070 [compost metagenome]
MTSFHEHVVGILKLRGYTMQRGEKRPTLFIRVIARTIIVVDIHNLFELLSVVVVDQPLEALNDCTRTSRQANAGRECIPSLLRVCKLLLDYVVPRHGTEFIFEDPQLEGSYTLLIEVLCAEG